MYKNNYLLIANAYSCFIKIIKNVGTSSISCSQKKKKKHSNKFNEYLKKKTKELFDSK